MALFRLPGGNDPSRKAIYLIGGTILLATLIFGARASHPLLFPDGPVSAVPTHTTMVASDPAVAPEAPLPGPPPDQELDPLVLSEGKRIEGEVQPKISSLTTSVVFAFSWLRSKTEDELRAQAIPRDVWHTRRLMRSPDAWRGEILHVYGILADQKTVAIPGATPGLQTLFQLTLYDPVTQGFYVVLTPRMPKGARVLGQNGNTRGSPLAFNGVFLSIFPFVSDNGAQPCPLFLAPKVDYATEGPTPRPRLDEYDIPGAPYAPIIPEEVLPGLDRDFLRGKLFQTPIGDTRQAPITHDLAAEKTGIEHALSFLFGPHRNRLAPMVNPEVHYTAIMADPRLPEWMVGEVVHVQGIALGSELMRFHKDAPGLPRWHLLTVSDERLSLASGTTPVWMLLTPNLPSGLREGDRVEAYGILLKHYPYRTATYAWAWAPLAAVADVHRLPPRPSPLTPRWMDRDMAAWAAGFVIAALLLGIAALWRMNRNDTNAMNRIRRRQLQKNLQEEKARLSKKKEQNEHD